VLLWASLARAAILAGAAFAGFTPLLVLAAVFTVLTALHKPAQAALLPRLAPEPARREAANAVWSAVDNAGFVAGASIAGVLMATAGGGAAFLTAAATFAAAAALLARITRDEPAGAGGHARSQAAGDARAARGGALTAAAGDPRAGRGGALTAAAGDPRSGRGGALTAAAGPRRVPESLRGLATVARDPRLRALVALLSATTLVEGMVDVLVVVAALDLIDLGGAGVGWLNAAWGVGGILGGATALSARRGQLALGALLAGAPLVALAAAPHATTALAALLVLGAGYALIEVAGRTMIQRLAHDEVRARVFAVTESSYWLTTGAGAMLASPLVAATGPRAALAIAGAALVTATLAYAAATSSSARATPSASTSRWVTARTVEGPIAPIRTPRASRRRTSSPASPSTSKITMLVSTGHTEKPAADRPEASARALA
jgi:predicted MFS family arabinose efflux permease